MRILDPARILIIMRGYMEEHAIHPGRMLTELTGWNTDAVEPLATITVILLIAGMLYALLKPVAGRIIPALVKRTSNTWDSMFVACGVFNRLAAMAPGVAAHALADVWMGPESGMAAAGNVLQSIAHLWILFFGMWTIHAVLDGIVAIYRTLPFSGQIPIRSFVQVIKLITVLILLILTLALLLGKSPALLLSGMGAMTAVLMLVFKDPILGFVAGVQLSANRMLAVGDWLEMSKYDADGDVIEVSLTTVKVRNWDQTITTIPTYALISDSFKNWRGMTEAGGRRIKRSLFIDMSTIHFLNDEDIDNLRKAQLLTDYIQDKLTEIDKFNREHGVDPESPVNGRRLTNIGTFRAYLVAYLKSHTGINQNLIMIVRQLQPTSSGLPIEIYAFTSDTGWIAHEGVQSDIFDHILAVVPQFGLRVFQSPSGSDILHIAGITSKKNADNK